MNDPRIWQPGDIWDDGSGYTFALHFVEAVESTRLHVALVYTPSVWPPSKSRPKASTYYSKHLGHDSWIPFSGASWAQEFWARRWTKYGSLPALIGQKSVKIES